MIYYLPPIDVMLTKNFLLLFLIRGRNAWNTLRGPKELMSYVLIISFGSLMSERKEEKLDKPIESRQKNEEGK